MNLSAINLNEQIYLDELNKNFKNELLMFEHLRSMALQWCLPQASLAAIYLLPSAISGKLNIQEIDSVKQEQILKNITTLTASYNLYKTGFNNVSRFISLNHLIWQAYIDAPNFQSLLLMLALHDAFISNNQEDNVNLARYMLYVFTPFAEMLGLWQLRNKWLERTYKILQKKDEKIKIKFAEAKPIIDHVLANNEDPNLPELKQTLFQTFEKRKINVYSIQQRAHFSEDLLHRHINGYTIEEYLNHIWIKIICESEEDCYKILGIVHSLGPLAISRQTERFTDFISYPEEHGFRALETMVNISFPLDKRLENKSNKLVRVRIVSQEMENVNANGVIETQYISPNLYQNNLRILKNIWWNPQKYENQFYKIKKHGVNHNTMAAFLLNNPPGSSSKVLYVFTPKGDLILLPENSSPIDFAYAIHKEIGNYAKETYVNGKLVAKSHPLKNGDIVNIIPDKFNSQPEIAWLNYVKTKQARTSLKSQLFPEHNKQLTGYNALQKKLQDVINFYEKKKAFTFDNDKRRFEYYLKHYAKSNGFISLESFFQSITGETLILENKKSIPLERIIYAYLFEELFNGLYFQNKMIRESVTHHRVRFCRNCNPVPGEAIVGYEYQTGAKTRYKIHTKTCSAKPTSANKVRVRWLNMNTEKIFYRLDIDAQDRFGLIDAFLDPVYSQPHNLYLHQINAFVNEDHISNISLIISSQNSSYQEALETTYKNISGVRRVICSRISPLAALKWTSLDTFHKESNNPFFETIVYDEGKFYDREEPVNEILRWLAEEESQYMRFLIGQRRIGKTSLGYYLIEQKLKNSKSLLPIYFDLQPVIETKFSDFVEKLVEEIYKKAQIKPLPLLPDESLYAWFNRSINRLRIDPAPKKIFIFFDEFDCFVEKYANHKLSLEFLDNFINLLNTKEFRCILSLSETSKPLTRNIPPVQKLMQKTEPIQLEPIDDHFLHLLVRESLENAGYLLPDSHKKNKLEKPCSIITEIIKKSGGIPYFAKAIGFQIVNQLKKQNKNNITQTDLKKAINMVLLNGENRFFHFIENTNELQKRMLHLIANTPKCTTTMIIEKLKKDHQVKDNDLINQYLLNLEEQKIIKLHENNHETSITIQVELFSDWIKQNYLLRMVNHE